VIRVLMARGHSPGRIVNIALEIALIKMLGIDTKLVRGRQMNEDDYQAEIKKLEMAVKTLLYIVNEYMVRNSSGITDDHGHPLNFSAEMSAVRTALQQTETFKASWE